MKKDKKGFTLVELIVVLVILAILLAILVPALLRWIDKAKRSSLMVDCRTCVIAAQSIGAENYALGKACSEKPYDDVRELAEVDGDIDEIEYDGGAVGSVTHLTYAKGGHSVTYCADCASCKDHSESFTFDAVESSQSGYKKPIVDDSRKDYADSINAVLETLYDSVVKDLLKSEEKRVSWVLFKNGKVNTVYYYSSASDKKGNKVLYASDSDEVKALNAEMNKALEATEHKLYGSQATRIFFDWDGNIVANDKADKIGGQGAPADFRFDNNGVHIILDGATNTWK